MVSILFNQLLCTRPVLNCWHLFKLKISSFNRFGNLCVFVPGWGEPHQVSATILLSGHHICGHGNGGRERAVHVLRMADRVTDTVRVQHHQLRIAVLSTWDADVAPDPWPVSGSGRGRGVAVHGTSRCDRLGVDCGAGQHTDNQRWRSPVWREWYYGHETADQYRVLVAIHRAGCLEAGSDHRAVLCLPAGQRVLCAAVLLGWRT